MTRKIYFEPAGRIHSSQWEVIDYPPEGYEFVVNKSTIDKTLLGSALFLFNNRRPLEWLVPLNLIKARLEGFFKKIPEDIELIYSYNHPVFREKPWVVFVEWAHVLIGRDTRHFQKYKGLVQSMLASEHCKGILTWTELARQSMLSNLNCAEFHRKIEVVPQAVRIKDFVKNYNEEKVKLLFVGSANVPQDFDFKGGKEVLEAFSILNGRYKNLELVMRVRIPQYIKKVYEVMDNVRIIEGLLPPEQLEWEFMNADIFLYPSHETHNTVILDAMSYELPIVTTEIGSTGRIEDGATGFVVRNSKEIPNFWHNLIPTPVGLSPYRHKISSNIDPKLIEELVEKISFLIENPWVRRKMGKAARYEVEEGKFSIKKRNEKLKRIFDKAIA